MDHSSDQSPTQLLPLWQRRDFRLLWIGHSVSSVGSQITSVVLPLIAAVTLQATPAQMALLLSLQYAPATLVSLFAGVLVDRLKRRPLMIATDLMSAALLMVIPLVALFGWLRIEVLYGVIFVLGCVGVFYGLADSAFLPTLVPSHQRAQANGALAASSSTARIVGPGLGGLLVQWLAAPLTLLIDAATFIVSAVTTLCIRTAEVPRSPAQRPAHLWQEITEGIATIVANPYLRAFTLSSAALDVFWNALYAVYVLYVTRTLGLSPAAIGIIFSTGSVVALASAPLAAFISRRYGIGRTLIGSQILVGAGSLLIILALFAGPAALVLLLCAEAVQAGANIVFAITRDSVRQTVTPDHLLGRVGAATMCIGLGVALLGTLLGGALGERIGVAATVGVGAVGGVFAFVWLLRSPVRQIVALTDLPDHYRDR